MGRMLVMGGGGVGPLALVLLMCLLLGGVQGERGVRAAGSSLPGRLNVTEEQLTSSAAIRSYCEEEEQPAESCKPIKSCLEAAIVELKSETSVPRPALYKVLRQVDNLNLSLTREELCKFVKADPTPTSPDQPPSASANNGTGPEASSTVAPPVQDSATDDKTTTVAPAPGEGGTSSSPTTNQTSPGTNSTADPTKAEDGVNPLYWVIPVVVVLLLILGLIGILIRRYTKRVGFQSSGKTCGGEPIKNDGSDV